MGADFDHLAIVEDDQAVGAAQGGEAVGDGEGGAALYQAGDRLLDLRFGLGIQRRGRLVQDQDLRIVEDGPGDGKALLFTTGQLVPLLADDHVVAVRFFDDELVGIGGSGGAQNLVESGVRLAVADVLGDGAVEQKGGLGNQADLGAQVLQADLADVDPVDFDAAAGDVVETADQVDKGALADAGAADQADHLTGPDVEVDVAEHDLARVIAKGRVSEGDLSFEPGHGQGAGVVERFGLGVDYLEDALGAGEGADHEAVEVAEPLERTVEHPQVRDEGHQLAQMQLLAQNLTPPEIPDEEGAEAHEEVGDHEEDQPAALGADADVLKSAVAAVEAAALALLLGEGLDHADTGDRLVEVRGEPRPLGRPAAPVPLQTIPDQAAAENDRRHGEEDVDGQLPVHVEQEGEDTHYHQPVGDDVRDVEDEVDLDQVRVVGHARDEGTDLALVVEAQRQKLQGLVEFGAQIFDGAEADPGVEPAAHHLGHPGEKIDGKEAADEQEQQVETSLEGEHVVDDVLDHVGGQQFQKGGADGEQDEGDGPRAVGLHIADQAFEGVPLLDAGRTDAVLFGQHATALIAAAALQFVG